MNKTEVTSLNIRQDLRSYYNQEIPHIIKYMGSKRDIIDFVIKAVEETYTGRKLCDLFAGTGILAGSLGQLIPIHSNDIQEYSGILSNTYLSDFQCNM